MKRRRASRVKRILLFLICGFLLYFLGFIAVIHHNGTLDSAEESDVIIVLGAGLLRDGRPGWALTRRSLHGADLWRQGIAPYVLCAGGKAESYPRSEAAACREVLLSSGLPAGVIILEEKSRSTEENAIFSKRLMIDEGFADAVLVSDSYHMLRASWLFQLQGIETTSSPVPASRIRSPLSYPASLLREFFAFHWQFLKEVFQIPLTHLNGV
ncbi:MAG: YdcF family protein [Chloroflexi bacterium]|nr:YdcF family protein [Chloroflexota bacterium]